MIRKKCESVTLHHIGEDNVAEFHFAGGIHLVVTAANSPMDEGTYTDTPDYTEARLFAPGLSPHPKTGRLTAVLVVGTERASATLEPSGDSMQGVYASYVTAPKIQPWADLLLTATGPESGSVPVDHPEKVSLYHY